MLNWWINMKSCFLLAICGFSLLAQQALPANTVVATVAGQNVTIDDVRKMLETAPPQIGQLFQQSPQVAIQQYFIMRYLASEGERLKLAEQSPLKEQLNLLRENIVAQAMVNRERDGFEVTGDQIEKFYE